MKNVTIIGATGSLGRVLRKVLLKQTSHHVTLFARSATDLTIEQPERERVVAGDVFNSGDLDTALKDCDTAFAALSGDLPRMAREVVAAVKRNQVAKLIFVSSMGIYNEIPPEVGERGNLKYNLMLEDYRQAADVVEGSGINYTVLRPGWFDDGDDATNYQITHKGEPFGGHDVSRLSIADVVLKMIDDHELYAHESIGINRPEKGVNMPEQTYITLNDGNKIPQFGLGVYQVSGDQKTAEVCDLALGLGYRHIDTAHAYQNERGVGRAVKMSSVPREDTWITSKLWPSEYGEGKTAAAIDKMLERLDTPYLDLLLLHQQFGDYLGAWRDMEKAVRTGKVKSIGLSNFESERLEEVLNAAEIKPSVLQVECHPYYQQRELKERLRPYNIAVESWYPLGHGDPALLGEPLFAQLAEKYSKTPAQIILRWHIQEGNIIFPRSTSRDHLAENINIFDFAKTDDEMAQIRALDKNVRYFTMTLEEQEANLGAFVPAD